MSAKPGGFLLRVHGPIFLFVFAVSARAGNVPVASFTENHGQWPSHVLYRSLIPGGSLFVEKNALTYSLYRGGPMLMHAHDGSTPEEPLRAHAYRVTFEGANMATGEGRKAQPQYENFFIGNDPAKWGTRCGVFGEVVLHDLYPGIDLRFDGSNGLKYEFIVHAGADPSVIRMRFEGQDALELTDGRLIARTTAGDVIEEAPISYQLTDASTRMNVHSAYVLKKNTVRFTMDRITSSTLPLIIDPTLTFASYTGSNANNFGFTATYDHDGALYGGGIAFGVGYPVTLGVQQNTFQGGSIDIGLTKFSPNGTSLIWSTYLGGNGSETPHSLVVNSNNELFVLAATGSSDFPVTPGCFDNSFNGGVNIPIFGGWVNLLGGEGYGHPLGTDIAIAHFSADATTLIGCTYVGGSGNDGVNNSTQLVYNYGDHFRGEIALDALENPVIATSTQSVDMPVTAGVAQPAFGGGVQDAFLFRLNPALTTMMFATYCGGTQDDSGYGVQFASNGEIYMTGGTASSDMPMTAPSFDNSYNGADDGYIVRYSADGNTRLSSTFLGTNTEDQTYFVQLNTSDEVFVVGQTHGNYPVTPGKYANANSSQFIQKLSADLGTGLWSTRIGSGNGNEDISPSAFLVSDCGQIYFSGWGGTVNHNCLATASTTVGLPLTIDAFQSNTDGSDFYLMVLEPEAVALNYSTYFGGALSPEHVDGGTSRFDKNGNVYQAVCAGCWNNNDFPTTPGAWSNTNNGGIGACNLGVFKFNLSHPVAQIGINGPHYVCLPGGAQFTNTSIGGTNYNWTFGDGNSSSTYAPGHTYADTGIFVVTMILSDSNSCVPNDTAHITIAVVAPGSASIDPVDTVCIGQPVQLHAHGGYAYAWLTSPQLSDTTIADPIATPLGGTTYYVIVTDSCGSDTASVDVHISIPFGHAGNDTTMCLGQSVPITAIGGGTYVWSPSGSLNNALMQSPQASPTNTTLYHVQITTPAGCIIKDSLTVFVQFDPPVPVVNDTAICLGASVQLHASGGMTYHWDAAQGIVSLNIPDPAVDPVVPMHYVVHVSNTCGTTPDTAFVDVQHVDALAWPDTIICRSEPVNLFASGGTAYVWSPGGSLSASDTSAVIATPSSTTNYQVYVSNALGCSDTAFVLVEVFPQPTVDAGADQTIDFGNQAYLLATGQGILVWAYDPTLTCDTCASNIASPQHSTTYTVRITDSHGCKAADNVTVFINGTLYVPNTFTPNGDGINDVFFAMGTEVKTFKMYVFNRWGEDIFEGDRLNGSWDGTYRGEVSPIDTYVWRIDYTENNDQKHTVLGHVNLVR